MRTRTISAVVNGVPHTADVPVRMTLVDWLRGELGLTGTHVGCEHGVCGACTVLVNGASVCACLLFACQINGADVLTIEGLEQDGRLHPIQEAFWDHHALQCGYCTPGMIMSSYALLSETAQPDDRTIRQALAGNLCRCTGYVQIVEAVEDAAARLRVAQDEKKAV
jgi:carbon-monoxide dehydrogenase small subunit